MAEDLFEKLNEAETLLAYIQQTLNQKYDGLRIVSMEISYARIHGNPKGSIEISVYDYGESKLISLGEFDLTENGVKRCGEYVTGMAMMEGVI